MDEAEYLHVWPDEDGQLSVVYILVLKDTVFWVAATASASEVNGQTYYNVRRVPGRASHNIAEDRNHGYTIWRVQFESDDQLKLLMLNVDDAFEWGPDVGPTVKPGSWIGPIRAAPINCDGKVKSGPCMLWAEVGREELRELIRSAPERVWVWEGPDFKRVRRQRLLDR